MLGAIWWFELDRRTKAQTPEHGDVQHISQTCALSSDFRVERLEVLSVQDLESLTAAKGTVRLGSP